MTFQHLNRRLHLYLGLFLLPWFFMYGVSSVPFSHGRWIQERFYTDGVPNWKTRFERPYSIEVPEKGDLREVGARILKDAGYKGAYGTYRDNEGRLNIYWYNFWDAAQITYFPNEKRLRAQDRRFRLDHILGGMHARGGFEQSSPLQKAWGVTVDIVCIGFLLWIASGVYMWWQIRGHRGWGFAALAGGIISFAVFLMRL